MLARLARVSDREELVSPSEEASRHAFNYFMYQWEGEVCSPWGLYTEPKPLTPKIPPSPASQKPLCLMQDQEQTS